MIGVIVAAISIGVLALALLKYQNHKLDYVFEGLKRYMEEHNEDEL